MCRTPVPTPCRCCGTTGLGEAGRAGQSPGLFRGLGALQPLDVTPSRKASQSTVNRRVCEERHLLRHTHTHTHTHTPRGSEGGAPADKTEFWLPDPRPGWSRPEGRVKGQPGPLRKQVVTHRPQLQSFSSGGRGRDRHAGQGDRARPRQEPLHPWSAGSRQGRPDHLMGKGAPTSLPSHADPLPPLVVPPHLPTQASPVLAAKPVSCSKTRRFYCEIEDRGEKTQILSPAHQLRIWVSAQDTGPWGAHSPGQVSRPFLTPQGITSEQSV